MTIFDETPILWILQAIFCIAAFILLLFTTYIIARYPSASVNCKTFLLVIMFGHFHIILGHFEKIIWFWARNMFNPFYVNEKQLTLFYLMSQVQHESAYILVSVTEICLILERWLAIRLIDRYHSNDPRLMVIVIPILLIFCAGFGFILHFTSLKLPMLFAIQVFDIVSVVAAYLCHRYTKMQFHETLQRSLEDKHQIRDVASLSSALIPICIVSFFLKLGCSAIVWIYAIYGDTTSFMARISIYNMLHTANAISWCVLVLTRHRNMRRRAVRYLRFFCSCCYSSRQDSRSLPIDRQISQMQTASHFQIIDDMWTKKSAIVMK